MSEPVYNILVIGPSWAGDMVMAQSLFKALKQNRPDCRIDVLAPHWTFSLLQGMVEVNEAIEMPLGHGKLGLSARIKLGKQLRSRHYAQAILLPNSWKSTLIPFFADIPIRTGYVGECRWGMLNDIRRLDKNRLTMTVQRFVGLAYTRQAASESEFVMEILPPTLSVEPTAQHQVAGKFQLQRTDKILALCPGAEFGPAKRWPMQYYAEIAAKRIKRGWQVWLFGSEKDQSVCAEINQQTKQKCIDFSGRTSLAEAVALLSLVDTVVTNDSGLMHVAAALDKKIVAIYGSSDPSFTPPLSDKAKVVYLYLDCSPCFKRQCPFGHYNCLNRLYPEQVLLELNRL